MKNIEELKKIVVLIDADNAQLSKLKLILDEISTHGHIIVKKAYGDWSNPVLKNWKETLNELAIQPVQQFAYTTGKNATDGMMIIEAMDLLHTEKYDAFALVSSDSDFTTLAIRLRAAEMYVFGIGEQKTPQSFRNACDDFILTEVLYIKPVEAKDPKAGAAEAKDDGAARGKAVLAALSLGELEVLLDTAYEKYQDDSGWVNIGAAGSFIKRTRPDFDSRSFGFSKLTDLINSLPKKYEMTRDANSIAYRKKPKGRK